MTSRASTWLVTVTICVLGAAPGSAGFYGTDVFLPGVGAGAGVPPSYWYTTIWCTTRTPPPHT